MVHLIYLAYKPLTVIGNELSILQTMVVHIEERQYYLLGI